MVFFPEECFLLQKAPPPHSPPAPGPAPPHSPPAPPHSPPATPHSPPAPPALLLLV